MKKLLALLLAAAMLVLCFPAAAVEVQDWDPVGYDISNVHAAYLTAGGNPSTTDFLTAEDFAAHTITIINVWSDGCGPCIAEMPYFQQVHEEYGDRGVLIVGCCSLWISGSYAGEWNHLQSHGYTYMNVIQDSVLQGLYTHNNYVPQTFIVSSEGIVVDFIGGGTTYNNLVNKIGQWLGALSDEYYDVDFVDGVTGEIFETQNIHSGHTPVFPEPPVHEGYNFTGWTPSTPPVILGPTTITANYTIRTYRVRFYDSITGEKIATKYAQYGNPVEPPEAPEHEGYIFEGWDKDLSFISSAMDVYTIYRQEGVDPTPEPTLEPTPEPTLEPTPEPTLEPTPEPTLEPTPEPTEVPTPEPTLEPTPEPTLEPTPEPTPEPVPGDITGDGETTTEDALLVLRAALGTVELDPELEAVADVNGDGVVNTEDALLILRMALGL